MKLLCLSLVFLLLAFSNSTQELSKKERAQAKASEWVVKKILNHPEYYVPEEYESFKEIYDLSDEAQKAESDWLNARLELFKEMALDSVQDYDYQNYRLEKVDSLKAVFDSYDKEVSGYSIKHRYRAKEDTQNELYYESVFNFDLQMNVIYSKTEVVYLKDEVEG
jgi:hypothetical protein